MPASVRSGVVATLLYLLGALWYLRIVLPAPATLLPLMPRDSTIVGIGDQDMVVATIAYVARTLPTAPRRLYDGPQCFPVPHALALGDHMIGDGLLGLLPYWLSGGEPIFTANAVVVLGVTLAGVAMYTLVFAWTGSAGAAFVGGLLFAFLPTRLQDPGHPFCYANHWTPLVLLFLHRTVVRGQRRDAVALAALVSLQLLESFYQVWAMTVLAIPFGVALALRYPRRLAAALPALAVALAVTSGVAAIVLAPYLTMGHTWGVLEGRFSFLLSLSDFAPGHGSFPGTVALALAAAALLDRVRGRRTDDDPRLPFLAMGLVILWAVVAVIPIPFFGMLPSLTYIAALVVPGLRAVRGLVAIRVGVHLVTSFLAGYGVYVLGAGRRPVVRRAIVSVAAAAAFLSVFVEPWATWEFGTPVTLTARQERPSEALLALYRKLPPGPVFDVPFIEAMREILDQSHYVLMGAYHRQPVGACYNSFRLPVHDDLSTLAGHFPAPGMIDAIYALGFRSIVFHGERVTKGNAEGTRLYAAPLERTGRVERVGDADDHTAYAIIHAGSSAPAPFCLVVPGSSKEVTASPPSATIDFEFHDLVPMVCLHASPIQPTPLVARWTASDGKVVAEEDVSVLLPIAVEPGGTMTRAVPLAVPAPGTYDVSLTVANAPLVVVAHRPVRVTAPTPTQ